MICYFQSDNSSYERGARRRKKGSKVANVKSTDARESIGRRGKRKDEATPKLKQTLRLQKRIIELRLREERETLQKYINELRNSRPELNSSRAYFCPLELPNIAEFTESGDLQLNSLFARISHRHDVSSNLSIIVNLSFRNIFPFTSLPIFYLFCNISSIFFFFFA